MGVCYQEYRRPTFKRVVKRLRFRFFSRRLRIQLLRFGPAWTHPHVRNALIAFLIIANRGGGGGFAFAFKCGPTVLLIHYLPLCSPDVVSTFYNSPSADAKELLRDAKALAEATKSLMHALKAQADQDSDVNNSQRLHGAVKELAGATSRMAHLAKGVAAKKDLSAHGNCCHCCLHDVYVS